MLVEEFSSVFFSTCVLLGNVCLWISVNLCAIVLGRCGPVEGGFGNMVEVG